MFLPAAPGETDQRSPHGQPDAVAEHQAHDLAWPRAERDTHCDLATTPHDRIRHHAVDADRSQQRRQRATRADERRRQTILVAVAPDE